MHHQAVEGGLLPPTPQQQQHRSRARGINKGSNISRQLGNPCCRSSAAARCWSRPRQPVMPRQVHLGFKVKEFLVCGGYS